MELPNYKDGSIVNLMSSIAGAFGARTDYKELRIFPKKELSGTKNVVLLIIDGMGYEFLKEHGNGTLFKDNLKGKMTSVFPPTTAAAITSFVTATAPMQHAITGWFMYLKEAGVVSAPLPFMPRVGGVEFSKIGIKPEKIFSYKPIFQRIKGKKVIILPEGYSERDYNRYHNQGAKIASYKSLRDMLKKIEEALRSGRERKFIYAYWPNFDMYGHHYGIKHKKTLKHFQYLNKKIKKFTKRLKHADTTMIITADHGFVDTSKKKMIDVDKHPKLKECLTLPLCGEHRMAYCYVHPSKAKAFEAYVKKHFKNKCDIMKSEDMIKKNFFGLHKPSKKIFDRVGDYALIMKDNYFIRDTLEGEEPSEHVGRHGGISKEEMHVPLIVIRY